jgi:integrase
MSNPITLADLIQGFRTLSTCADASADTRLNFWTQTLGEQPAAAITSDDVEDALVRLAQRGRLKTVGRRVEETGKPLAEATVSRYLGTLAVVYKWARKHRYVPRSFVPPTRNVEKTGSPVDKNKFLTPEQVEHLTRVAKLEDRRWGKLAALITFLFNTGLRVGSAMEIRWGDVDWEHESVYVQRTKNGEPLLTPLTPMAMNALRSLSPGQREERVFGNRYGRPYHYRKLWKCVAVKAGMPDVTPHWLRHSCGTALARAGCNQATIQAQLGHKTLSASARYMHSNAEYQREALSKVEAFQC